MKNKSTADEAKKKSVLIKELKSIRKKAKLLESSLEKYKLTKEKNVDSIQRYQALFDLSPSGILFEDTKGNIIDANKAFCGSTGYTKKELIGKNIRIVVPPENYPVIDKHIEEILKGKLFEHEVINLRKDGTKHLVELREIRITLPDGKEGILCVVNDISDRKESEMKLRESEEHYRLLFELSPDAIVVHSEGKLIFVNHAGTKLIGASSPEELIGKPMLNFVHPDYHEFVIERIKKQVRGEAVPKAEEKYIRIDGTPIIVEVTAAPFQYHDKLASLVIIQDITEHKKAEEGLRQSESKMRALFNAMTDVILVVDSKGRYIEVASTNTSLLYRPPAEILGKTVYEIFPKGQANFFLSHIKQTLETREAVNLNYVLPIGGREIYFEARLTPLSKDKVLLVARDVTERKRTEDALRENEKKYKDLANLLPQTIFETNEKGILTFTNDKGLQSFGYTQNELFNKIHALQMVDMKDRKAALESMQSVLHGEKLTRQEYTALRKDGTTFPAIVSTNTIIRNGKVTGLRGVIIDITERKRVEMELETSLSLIKATLESTADGLLVVDDQGKISQFNQKFIDLWRIPENIMSTHEDAKALDFVLDQLIYPEKFFAKVKELYAQPDASSFDILEFKDGRVFERYSQPQVKNNKSVGRVWSFRDVTAQKKTEEKLIENENRYRSLFLNMLEGYAYCKMIYKNNKPHDFMYLEVNNKFESLTGLKNVIGKKVTELIPDIKETNPELFGIYGRVALSGKPERFDANINQLGIWLSVSVYSTQPEHFVAVFDNITDRKKTELETLQQKTKFQQLFENSPAGIVMLDENDRVQYINKGFETIFQYSFEEIKGRYINDIVSPEGFLDEASNLSSQTILGNVVEKESVRKRKDGSLVSVHIYGIPIEVDQKRIGIYGMYVDITERKRAETELRENQKLLSTVIETMPIGIWVLDKNGKIIHGNSVAQNIWGGAKYVGMEKYDEYKAWWVKDGKMVQPDEWAAVAALTNGKITINDELEIECFDGQHKFIYNSVVPIRRSQNEIAGAVVVNQDITERKNAEKELLQAKERAESSDKIKSEFLSQMSHEIRTPLNVLLSQSVYINEELGERKQLTDDLSESFLSIKDSGRRIIRTIELILSMSELQSGSYDFKPKQTDLYSEIIQQLYEEFKPLTDEKKLKFTIIKNTNITSVNIDSYAVKQIFNNLVDNAIKFTKKGSVTINIEKNERENLTVYVEDTGIGISEDYLSKLFTPFLQESHGYSRSYEGTGLGLALVKKFCDMNNILIEVQSAKEKGSTFKLTFLS